MNPITWIFVTKTLKYEEAKEKRKKRKRKRHIEHVGENSGQSSNSIRNKNEQKQQLIALLKLFFLKFFLIKRCKLYGNLICFCLYDKQMMNVSTKLSHNLAFSVL